MPSPARDDDSGHETKPPSRTLPPILAFVIAWAWLDVVFNLRAPATDHLWWAWLPSADVTVLLVGYAAVAQLRRRVSMAVTIAIAVGAVAVRIFRVGDGVTRRYFNRPLDLALDLPLSPELVRLLNSTVSRPWLIAGTIAAIVVIAGVGVAVAWALRRAERFFARVTHRAMFAGVAGAALLASVIVPDDGGAGVRTGVFGASLAPIAAKQISSWRGLDGRRAAALAQIRATDKRLRASPHRLDKLRGTDVLVFLVESYGATVVDVPDHARRIAPVYERTEAVLRGAGFDVASRLLVSPTTAGRSWLAQETLATGVAVPDHLTDALVQSERPTTMARLFHEAGYRTVIAQPGSTHRTLDRWIYDFEQVDSAWDFDYRGPGFRWAPMPDQFVLDWVRRHEIVARVDRPLFVEYALVSSHAPWSDIPSIVADWNAIGDGRVFDTLPVARFPITWTNLSEGDAAYLHAVAYDLAVIADYVRRFVAADALVVVLGDHQPVAEVTRFSPSRAVPVHVICRSRAVIDAFRARGYASGMWPRTEGPSKGLEMFLPDLLADFSRAR